MQKRFIAVSTVVVALALVLAFSACSARADSIHSQDLKLDSSGRPGDLCGVNCILDSVFFGNEGEILTLLSKGHVEVSKNALTAWEKDLSRHPDGPLGFPIASHFTHREGDGGPRSTPVPEPASWFLAVMGLTGLMLYGKTRRRNPRFPGVAV